MNKEIEEIAINICKGCKPRTKCKNTNCTMSNIVAEYLYNAGYRKTFTSSLATNEQKAFKEGYNKGLEESKIVISKNQLAILVKNASKVISLEDIRKLQENKVLCDGTDLDNYDYDEQGCIDCQDKVRKEAVKDFTEKFITKLDEWITTSYEKSVKANGGYHGGANNAFHDCKKFLTELAKEFGLEVK